MNTCDPSDSIYEFTTDMYPSIARLTHDESFSIYAWKFFVFSRTVVEELPGDTLGEIFWWLARVHVFDVACALKLTMISDAKSAMRYYFGESFIFRKAIITCDLKSDLLLKFNNNPIGIFYCGNLSGPTCEEFPGELIVTLIESIYRDLYLELFQSLDVLLLEQPRIDFVPPVLNPPTHGLYLQEEFDVPARRRVIIEEPAKSKLIPWRPVFIEPPTCQEKIKHPRRAGSIKNPRPTARRHTHRKSHR